MKAVFELALAAVFLAPMMPSAYADASHHAAASVHAAGAETTAAMSEGDVKKVDKETGKLTIRHGELRNLGMPPMTMVFQVPDKSLLAQVKPGDKVKFVAEKMNGKLTVTRLSPAQ
jgi:Cu/Ag efflux protein CusF